jgi:hypothetical protein
MPANKLVILWLRQYAHVLRESGERMGETSSVFEGLSPEVCKSASEACLEAARLLEEKASSLSLIDFD